LAAGLAVVFLLSTRNDSARSTLAKSPTTGLATSAANPEVVGGLSELPDSEFPDDELEIALEFEALADFDVIEQLEVLELLVALDDEPAGFGS
jgi:hypothetical protein